MTQYAIESRDGKYIVAECLDTGNLKPIALVNTFRYATCATKQMNFDFVDDSFDATESANHLLNPGNRFGYLPAGSLFHFPGSPVIWQRTKSGYKSFSHNATTTWKTGTQTAVIHIGQLI